MGKGSSWLMLVLPWLLFVSCLSGKIDFTPPPVPSSPPPKSVTIDKPKDDVWKTLIANLADSFFVINNLDKESGFINLSYSATPCKYLLCGLFTSDVSNARGPRSYSFPGCSEFQRYEVVTNNQLVGVDRTMKLEGRVNIIVQPEETSKTRVVVNVRYLVTKEAKAYDVGTGRRLDTHVETINFDSGGSGQFSAGSPTSCRPNYLLESEILKLTQK
jgi:hypothetical protein